MGFHNWCQNGHAQSLFSTWLSHPRCIKHTMLPFVCFEVESVPSPKDSRAVLRGAYWRQAMGCSQGHNGPAGPRWSGHGANENTISSQEYDVLVKTCSNIVCSWLVVWLPCFFFHLLGISSSQLSKFFRGVEPPARFKHVELVFFCAFF